MKAKVFVTSLLIAVLSGCEVPEPAASFTAPLDETGGPSPELLYQPPLLRKIAPPDMKIAPPDITIIFSTAFVAIELGAGPTAMAIPPVQCPPTMEVGNLVNCLASPGCGSPPDPTDLRDLNQRVKAVPSQGNGSWRTSDDVDGPLFYVADDSHGTLIVANGNVDVSELTYVVTSNPSGSFSDLPCGGEVQAPCQPPPPGQCPGGSNPGPRILDAINRAVQDHPGECVCDEVCNHPPPLGSCPCAETCQCPC